MHSTCAVVLPVGPSDFELWRLRATVENLRSIEGPDRIHLVMVDDAPTDRRLESIVGSVLPSTVVRTPLWEGRRPPAAYDAMIAGSMMGFAAARASGAKVALKLDTDAVVLRPFADRLAVWFGERPTAGAAGSCRIDCEGQRRDTRGWEEKLRKLGRTPTPLASSKRRSIAASIALASQTTGFALGDHCLGGAYALSKQALEAVDWESWPTWIGHGLGEDVAVSTLVSASGWALGDFTDAGAPGGAVFGLRWQGLPRSPEDLAEAGFSVVHSVKRETESEEQELRAELFRAVALVSS